MQSFYQNRRAESLAGRAREIRDRAKEAYHHAEILKLAMIGADRENGLDFARDALIDAAYDLTAELGRLARDMADPKAEGDGNA